MWDSAKIEHKKDLLKKQLLLSNGRFAIFIIRLYKYIENQCKENETNWCYDSVINRKAIKYVYNGPIDHMGSEVIEDAKRHLREMGYIECIRQDEKTKIYIIKEIDFCNIDDYTE